MSKRGKIALITGASRGLGYELARLFSEIGYGLIVMSRTAELPPLGSVLAHVQGDIRSYRIIDKAVNAVREFGLDLLIHNAAVYEKATLNAAMMEVYHVMDTNLIAPILLTQRVWPEFQKRGGGMIVFINSLAGKTGAHEEGLYCASKHGLRGFADSLQFDGVRDNVRVLSLYLGAMCTSMTEGREGRENFIDPVQAGMTIRNICETSLSPSEVMSSLRLTSIDMTRMKY